MKIIIISSLTLNLYSAESNQPLVDGLLKQNEQLTKIIEENNKIIYSSQEKPLVSSKQEEMMSGSVPTSHRFSIALNYASIDGYRNLENMEGDVTRLQSQPAISLGWSPLSNIWLEGSLGQNTIENYPSIGLGTSVTTYSIRAKYEYEVMNSGFLIAPYLGYQRVSANLTLSESYYENEQQYAEDLTKSRIIFGASASVLFLNNWQARLEWGSDWLAAGLGYRL